MATVGEQLKQAREAQKLTVYQIAEMTKIRTDHIRALDEGNYDVFSAPVYIRGFVRTYATVLKLDAKRMVELLNHEMAESGQQEPSLSEPKQSLTDAAMFQLSKVNWRLALPALAAALVIAASLAWYSAWTRYQSENPLAGLTPGMYEPSLSFADTLPLPVKR
jgi:cytoskeletal protein RodZ